MNRNDLQQLASDRLDDAETLRLAGRWSGAYYLAGYAVECGLKACILARLARSPEVIFDLRRFSERCWTHNLGELVLLSELELARDQAAIADPAFGANWLIVKEWTEASRYEQHLQADAERLVLAVNDPASGVMQWIRGHW
jgi:HEPN domain-containing protein